MRALIINRNYELSEEQLTIKEKIESSDKTDIKYIEKQKSTKIFRNTFEQKTKRYDVIYLFEIYHLTIDINYIENLLKLLDENNKLKTNSYSKFIIICNSKDIAKLFYDANQNDNALLKQYMLNSSYLENLSKERKDIINQFLKKSVQKIGREKSKEKAISKDKNWKFGRPKGKCESQYDGKKLKERIRYHLETGKTPKQIYENVLQQKGSLNALRHFIKTRFRKNYL